MHLKMRLCGLILIAVTGIPSHVGSEERFSEYSGWMEMCKAPVCMVVKRQAEGLARLKVLSNYIKETMILMDSVVTSLDEEIMEVTEELRHAVGRRCHSRGEQSALHNHFNREETNVFLEGTTDSNETADILDDSAERLTSVLSSETDTVLGSSTQTTNHDTSQNPSSFHKTTSPRPSGFLNAPQTSQRPSSSSTHSSQDDRDNTSQSSSRVTQGSSTVSLDKSVGQHQSGSENDYETQSSSTKTTYVAPSYPQYGGRSGKTQQQGAQGVWKGSHGPRRGHGAGKSWGKIKHTNIDSENLDNINSNIPSLECLGVPEGSPHHVPGLDVWCQNNCFRGYCPSTHCICY